MAFFFVEITMEGATGVHGHLPLDLAGLQVHPLTGAAGAAGEANQVVQAAVHRFNIRNPCLAFL